MVIDNWNQLPRMWSVQLQAVWVALCAVYIAMSAEKQAALLALVGLEGPGAAAAVELFAAMSVVVSGSTIAARAARQPALHAPVTEERGA